MNHTDARELAAALESLFQLDRMSGCSDRYFRQVCTAKIKAIQAAGFAEKLAASSIQNQEESK